MKYFSQLVLTPAINGHCESLNTMDVFREISGPNDADVKWRMKTMNTQQVKWPHNTYTPEWLWLKSSRGERIFLGGTTV
jgi:hypothetical protein